MEPRQRPAAGQQLAAAGAIEAPLAVGAIQGDEQPGARLVGDRVQREQRLAHSPRPPVRELLERRLRRPSQHPPLLSHQFR